MATKKPAAGKKAASKVVEAEVAVKPAKPPKKRVRGDAPGCVHPDVPRKPKKVVDPENRPTLTAKAIGREAAKPDHKNIVGKSITFAELQAKIRQQSLPSVFSLKK